MIANIEIPRLYTYLLEPARYKVAYGGRGGLKTWSYARAAILLSTLYGSCADAVEVNTITTRFEAKYGLKGDLLRRSIMAPHLILCTREIQESIKKSVHSTIVSQIEMLGLRDVYDITDIAITHRNGSRFVFEGLRKGGQEHNIKGIEDVSICWVEEGENTSERSLRYLRPTIRRNDFGVGSEIWVTFNTRYLDDPIYKQFVANPPESAVVRFINITDVPRKYINQTLWEEYQTAIATMSKGEVDNIWHGQPVGAGRKVWPDFVNETHPRGHLRVFPWELVKARANCYMVMDPAQHYYPACMWVAKIPRDTKNEAFYHWVYAEWPTFGDFNDYFCNVRKKIVFNGALSDIARQIYIYDGTAKYGLQIRKRYIDTRFAKGSGAGNYYSGQTTGIVEQFAKPENGGILFDCPPERSIDVQKSAIATAMRWNKLADVGPTNEPTYYVAPWCLNTIDAMSNHRLEDEKEQEHELRKDFSDCHKICWAGMDQDSYIDPAKPANIHAGLLANRSWVP